MEVSANGAWSLGLNSLQNGFIGLTTPAMDDLGNAASSYLGGAVEGAGTWASNPIFSMQYNRSTAGMYSADPREFGVWGDSEVNTGAVLAAMGYSSLILVAVGAVAATTVAAYRFLAKRREAAAAEQKRIGELDGDQFAASMDIEKNGTAPQPRVAIPRMWAKIGGEIRPGASCRPPASPKDSYGKTGLS